MFDIGFWELLLIAIVALFVIGPEKLPGFIRKVSLWVKQIQRFIQQTRREINQELLLHEQQSFKEKIDDLDNLIQHAPDKTLDELSESSTKPNNNSNHE